MNSYPYKLSAFLLIVASVSLLGSCIHSDTPKADHPARTDSLVDYANRLLKDTASRQYIRCIDSLYKDYATAGPGDLWKKYQQQASYYVNYEVDPGKAKLYVDSMRQSIGGFIDHYKEQYVFTIFAEADVLILQHQYNQAFSRYYAGLLFARRNLDSCTICQFSYKLGLVKYRQGKYLEAIPYIAQALAENDYCTASSRYEHVILLPQSMLNTIALCYERVNRLDSASGYYNHALLLLDKRATLFPKDKMGIDASKGVILGNLGGVYLKLHKYSLAIADLRKSIAINNHPGYEMDDAITAEIKLTTVFLQLRNFSAADSLLYDIERDLDLQASRHHIDNSSLLKWHFLKWQYLHQTGQLADAYNYSTRYYAIKDSLDSINSGLYNADMEMAFRSIAQEQKLIILSKDNRYKNYSLIVTIVFIVLGLTVVSLVILNLKKTKQQVAQLRGLSGQISRQNDQLRTTLHHLEQSQEDNTHLLQVVAHDLRNPIGGISMLVQLMLGSDRNEDDQKMLLLMKSSAERSLALANNLLQSNADKERLDKQKIDLRLLLQDCVNLLQLKASEKQQQITLESPRVEIMGDSEKLWRVISNLLTNAIKFSPSGSQIDVNVQVLEDNVLLSITDQGIGIPTDKKDKIFNIWADTRRPGTSGEQSFGLGLPISRQIVEAHEGTLWFESNAEKGTRFYIKLPLL